MSIDAALGELNKNVLALTEALKITAANQERLIAGQAAALDKVEAPKRGRPTKKDEVAAETTAAAAASDAAATTPPAAEASAGVTVSADELKQIGVDFLTAAKANGGEAVKVAGEFIKAVAAELGTPKLNGEESTLDADGRKKAAFFIRRKAEGLSVNFQADYDFDGDVTQGGEAEADAAGDEDF